MTTIHQKREIMQNLNRLDAVQSEKVLGYIKELLYSPPISVHREHVRRKAMKEIGQALRGIRE